MSAHHSHAGAFDAMLRTIAAMPTIVGQLTTHRPQVAPHHGRIYRSLGDVMAYEAGYLAHVPGKRCGALPGTPYACGWDDAAADWDDGAGGSNDGGEPVEAS